MLKHYSFRQKASMIITIIFYILFFFMVVYAAIYSHGDIRSILFAILGVVALVFGILNEYIKLLYNEALWYLNFKLDTKKASEYYDRLCKVDIFKSYVKDRGLFDTMVAIEEKDGQRALKIIQDNDKKFTANVEMLLIKLYYEMRAYLLLGRDKKINECYNDVRNIEKMKKRPKIFQYDELDGIHERALNNRGRAYELFQNVNTAYMNPKEKKFILENLVFLAPVNEKKEYQEQLDALMEAVRESK